ncbi:MAG: VanW family protein [Patescibacteria group bacterium]|nr:VanW family protein [Patescibacteria group bacterium]MDD4611192.1 VanW family protein [Patescibacteria group bacterium]
MFLNKKNEQDKPNKMLPYFIIAFLVVLAGGLIFCEYYFQKNYKDKIYPNIYIDNIYLSGRSLEEARAEIGKKISTINQSGIEFIYDDQKTVITPSLSFGDADFAYSVLSFDADATARQAFSIGRSGNKLNNFFVRLKSIIFKKYIPLVFEIDQEKIKETLADYFKNSEILSSDAALQFTKDTEEKITFSIAQESYGKVINYDTGIDTLKENLNNLNFSPITLHSESAYPQILKSECLNIESEAEKIISQAPLILKSGDDEWKVNAEEIANWLKISKIDGVIKIDLNNDKFKEFLNKEISAKVERKVEEARFAIKDGKVSEFQAGQNGIEINTEETIAKIKSDFFTNATNTVEIITKETKSLSQVSETNNLGIKEIIGTGHSNFAGSPANRRHNIKNGAQKLAGILIKPEEEFSLVKTLGEVEASTGYLPELVIKGNKTTPEYGGGLCQIATTVFRAAMGSGLPITERRNHSYRVTYYEPAGMDAAVYIPKPDVRFINDTGNNILVQYRIEGNDLYFDFWGTGDGRSASTTKPVVYNISRPAPTKIIETLDLKPGEKKCTERAHNGADTYFDYTVNYPNGETKEKRFSSHYVPWQEICLLGVEKLSATSTTENLDGTATSTNATSTTINQTPTSTTTITSTSTNNISTSTQN